jgi:adenylosuccinate synthase
MEAANELLAAAGLEVLAVEEQGEQVRRAVEQLRPYAHDTIAYLHEAMEEGRNLLFEGAQGTFLDLDFGTYPFVTSSNTTAGGACTGSGVPPNRIDRVIGVCKAYTTRVGTGPFPTEDDGFGTFLHGLGREYGATTGRERRCGWLDLVLLRQAVMINGVDHLAVTNLDGLDQMETIRVCRAYQLDGEERALPPARVEAFEQVQPVYDHLPGWQMDLSEIRWWDDLPSAAINYLEYLEDSLRVKVALVGVGPDRQQTLIRPDVAGAFSPGKELPPPERELLA